MWINKNKYIRMEYDIDLLRGAVKSLAEQHERLLTHLNLGEWTEQGKPAETKIVTGEEYKKRTEERISQQQALFYAMNRQPQNPFHFGIL